MSNSQPRVGRRKYAAVGTAEDAHCANARLATKAVDSRNRIQRIAGARRTSGLSRAVAALACTAMLAGAPAPAAQPAPPARAVAIAKKLELLQRYLQSSRSEKIDAGGV